MQIILVTFLIIFFFIIIFFLSNLKIEINGLKIDDKNYIKKYNINLSFYLYKFKYLKINLKRKKNKKGKFLKLLLGEKVKFSKDSLKKILKVIKIYNIEKINLKVEFGTEDVILTSYITAITSSAIGVVLANKVEEYNEEKVKFKITPYYINKNFFNIELDCIIFTKIVHIIHIIIKQRKRRDKKDGRTSNRKFNVNSYG